MLAAFSFLLQGWTWPQRYSHQLMQPSINPSIEAMPNLHGLLFQLPGVPGLEVMGAGIVAGLCWIACDPQRDSLMAFSSTMLSGLLISHHAYVQDAALLVPVGLIIVAKARNPETRLLGVAFLCPVLWVLLMVPNLRMVPVLYMVLCLAVTAFAERSVGEACPEPAHS